MSLRPSGTVEVQCSHSGCGWCWWVDPLDPRLPNGPFDCGEDHDARRLVERALARLQVETGIQWGCQQARGPEKKECQTNECNRRSVSAGCALVHDRTRLREGLLEWSTPSELASVQDVMSRIDWAPKVWPEGMMRTAPSAVAPGFVETVNYQLNGGKIRRYTFAPCSRPGCGHQVLADYDRPSLRLRGVDSYSVGAWGGSRLPVPEWWSKESFMCGDTLGTTCHYPCEVVTGQAMAEFERTGIRWTMWDSRGDAGTVLFFDPEPRVLGVLKYTSDRLKSLFENAKTLSRAIHWVSMANAQRILEDGDYSTIFHVVNQANY